MNDLLTAERLRELLSYDCDTGEFRWRKSTTNSVRVGAAAGRSGPKGYRLIKIDCRTWLAHRLAWLYVHGRWPASQIDHINGDKADNRLANLREATAAENQHNKFRAQANNRTSGLLGVCWHKRDRRWVAQIKVGGKVRHIGLFATPEAAHDAYLKAKAELHPFASLAAAA